MQIAAGRAPRMGGRRIDARIQRELGKPSARITSMSSTIRPDRLMDLLES